MSAAPHTLGPLLVKPEAARCCHNGDIAVVNAKGTLVALAYARPIAGEALANARLIAAAPELLEACQKLAEWDQREKDHAISFRERIDLCDEAFRLMNSAIAKATGNSIPSQGTTP